MAKMACMRFSLFTWAAVLLSCTSQSARGQNRHVHDFAFATWNVNDARGRWAAVWERMVNARLDVLAIQETGYSPSAEETNIEDRFGDFQLDPNFNNQPPATYIGGRTSGIDIPEDYTALTVLEYTWRNGRDLFYFYYYGHDLRTDPNQNMAIVTRMRARRTLVVPAILDAENLYPRRRPIIGVQIENAIFFNIHAAEPSGAADEAVAAVNVIANFMAVDNALLTWTLMGDFNREPANLRSRIRPAPPNTFERVVHADTSAYNVHGPVTTPYRQLEFSIMGGPLALADTYPWYASPPAQLLLPLSGAQLQYDVRPNASDHKPVKFNRRRRRRSDSAPSPIFYIGKLKSVLYMRSGQCQVNTEDQRIGREKNFTIYDKNICSFLDYALPFNSHSIKFEFVDQVVRGVSLAISTSHVPTHSADLLHQYTLRGRIENIYMYAIGGTIPVSCMVAIIDEYSSEPAAKFYSNIFHSIAQKNAEMCILAQHLFFHKLIAKALCAFDGANKIEQLTAYTTTKYPSSSNIMYAVGNAIKYCASGKPTLSEYKEPCPIAAIFHDEGEITSFDVYNGDVAFVAFANGQMKRCNFYSWKCHYWNGAGTPIRSIRVYDDNIYASLASGIIWKCDTERQDACANWNKAGVDINAIDVTKKYIYARLSDGTMWRCERMSKDSCEVWTKAMENVGDTQIVPPLIYLDVVEKDGKSGFIWVCSGMVQNSCSQFYERGYEENILALTRDSLYTGRANILYTIDRLTKVKKKLFMESGPIKDMKVIRNG